MEERIKEIKSIYNDCAKNFNQYLSDHDMAAYNKRSRELMEKYKHGQDLADLLFWFAPKVQTIHDEWRKSI